MIRQNPSKAENKKEELEEVNDLLGKEKTLMAVCLLRNVFEEIMYIIATTIETVDIDIMTKASYFYKIVAYIV